MAKYDHVKRSKFVRFGPNGELEELFCKMCGTAIGGMTEKVKGRRFENGVWIEERILQFRRFHNYVELKMEFWDGSAHVTSGCRDCLGESLTSDQMYELHLADMEMDLEGGGSHAGICKTRVPRRVVAVRSDGGGLA